MELIPEKGYNAIPGGDITECGTLNRATFYLHYHDKDDLLFRGMQEVLDEKTSRTPLPVAGDGTLSTKETIVTVVTDFEHLAEKIDFYRVMLGNNGTTEFVHRLEDYVYENTAQRLITVLGELPSGPVPTEIVLRFLASAYVGMITWWLEKDMPYPPKEMASLLVRLYILGVFQSLGLKANIVGLDFDE